MAASSGFVRVASSPRLAAVLARRCGRLVWACRPFARATCASPAPACLFVPVRSMPVAVCLARLVAGSLGWRVEARRGASGSAVWSAVGLPVPPASVKVCLPRGVRARHARQLLRPLACLAGVFCR